MSPEQIILINRRTIERNLGRPIKYRSDHPAFKGKTLQQRDDMIGEAEYMEYWYGVKNELLSTDFL